MFFLYGNTYCSVIILISIILNIFTRGLLHKIPIGIQLAVQETELEVSGERLISSLLNSQNVNY